MNENKTILRVRGVIPYEDRMLVVYLPQNDFYCLAGGKLEWGEDIRECLKRELEEELGVEPEVGRLLYVNSFTIDNGHGIDFVFEVLNGKDYLGCEQLERTHAFEISDICWTSKKDDIKILPEKIHEDFKNGTLLSDLTRFINF